MVAVNRRKQQRGSKAGVCSPVRILMLLASLLAILMVALMVTQMVWMSTQIQGGTTTAKQQQAPGADSDSTASSPRRAEVVAAAAAQPDDTLKSDTTSQPATVAFAVSVTGCGSDPITEGGAVLQHSIHRASVRGSLHGKYDYKLFAIYHPDAAACAEPLAAVGYELLKRETFVQVSEIEGDFLRSKIEQNGCCGEKELIKLEAFTLTDYPIVVHLDLDVLILKPLDDLFDMMLLGPQSVPHRNDIVMQHDSETTATIPERINAFYTYDYNMVRPTTKYRPVQGGFFVSRPDMAVYEEFRAIVKKGDFQDRKGWGGVVGPFYGSMTFQGLLPYYYDYLHPGQSVELNRCIYNQMCDNPRTGRTVNDVVAGDCRTGQTECEDCRSRPIEDVVTTHFTLCQKPWWCGPHTQDIIQHRLCRKLSHEWFKVRSELEQSWGRTGYGPYEGFEREHFYGYCKFGSKKGYLPIQEPYGTVADA